MDSLNKLYGIGPTYAKSLYSKLLTLHLIEPGVDYTEDDIRDILKKSYIFRELPVATQVDLKVRPDKIVPHNVLAALDKEIKKYIRGIKINIAGSYRRGKETSRDVDIVVSRGNYKNSKTLWDSFVTKMRGSKIVTIMEPYAFGPDKISVIFKVKCGRKWKLKADIFITDPAEYIFMLLYATGSGKFNIQMRAVAKKRGYLLNQKGLYHRASGEKIIIKTEKDIFNVLNMTYRTPKDRV